MTLLDADTGLLNVGLRALPFIDDTPFDIFSIGGIVWAHLMTNGISIKVMLMTPALRNMDAGLEEAARVSGASNIRTMLRVTLPLMISPLALVFALQLLRIFQSFETELLLGRPFGFYVYSTKIYELVRIDPPSYGQATVLASLTLMLVALIIPLQRWVITRRQYTTITGSFKPGLIDLGIWRYPRVRHDPQPAAAAYHLSGGDSRFRQLYDAGRPVLPELQCSRRATGQRCGPIRSLWSRSGRR